MPGPVVSEVFYKLTERLIHFRVHLLKNFKGFFLGTSADAFTRLFTTRRHSITVPDSSSTPASSFVVSPIVELY